MTAVFKIDNTSEIFLLIGYTITARETRHRSGSVSYEYTDIPKNKGNPTETEPIQFYACRTFRRRKKGRAGALCQRSARKGRAGIFEKHTFSSIQNCCAPLTRRESSPKLRTPKGSAEKLRKRDILLGFCMGIYGFYQGKVRAEFLAKEFSA